MRAEAKDGQRTTSATTLLVIWAFVIVLERGEQTTVIRTLRTLVNGRLNWQRGCRESSMHTEPKGLLKEAILKSIEPVQPLIANYTTRYLVWKKVDKERWQG